jgi:hypothetical protein
MVVMDSKKSQKVAKNLNKNICNICNYITGKSSDYKKHLLTPKHEKMTGKNEIQELTAYDFYKNIK